jgi:hypothetical protein
MSLDVNNRSNERGRARDAFLGRVGFDPHFDVLQFILLNNELIEKGFVITEKNREEKYLEIINSEDPDLLEVLQNFLGSLDRLSPHLHFFRKYIEVSKAIDVAQSNDEVVTLVDDYLKLF